MLRSVGVHDPQLGIPLVFELVDMLPRVDDAGSIRRDLRIADALPMEPVLRGEQRLGSRLLRPERTANGRDRGANYRHGESSRLCDSVSPTPSTRTTWP